MKKLLIILSAILIVLLAACGQTGEQPSGSQGATVTETEHAAAPTQEAYYMEEIEEADGTKITRCHLGSEDGTVVWSKTSRPDGSFIHETFDEEGKLLEKTFLDSYGATCQQSYYPNGNLQKKISESAGGDYTEQQYREDGMLVYQKTVQYDSRGVETVSETKWEADGSRSFFLTNSDGMTSESYFDSEEILLKSAGYDPNTRIYAAAEYYRNGSMKSYTIENRETDEYTLTENYESGAVKRICNVTPDGLKHDQIYDEEGYTTYLYKDSLLGSIEIISDETGKVIKYIENGVVLEGSSIPYSVITTFNFRSK